VIVGERVPATGDRVHDGRFDRLVYELHGLSGDETKIVES